MDGSKRGLGLALLALTVVWCPYGAADLAAAAQSPDIEVEPHMPADVLVFDSTVINVGQLSEDDVPRIYRFTFTNIGKKPIVITKVASSCGCVAASFSREPVKAGQKSAISVKFAPKGHPGNLARSVFVYTNASAKHPVAKLTLRGFVHPTKDKWQGYRVVMGSSLRAKNNRMAFKAMPRQGVRIERIECVNTGTEPLKLSVAQDKLPGYITFRTEPEVIAPEQTADMVVTIDADAIPEEFEKTAVWTLLIEGLEGGPEQRSLRIEADFVN